MADPLELEAHTKPYRHRLTPLLIDEILALPPRKTFVKRLLALNEMSVWYGEPGCGKSFLLTDLGLHVAHGRPWFGRRTDSGLVIYIAAEGGGGFRRRIEAFFRHYEWADIKAPFSLIPTTVSLIVPAADTSDLLIEIKKTAARVGEKVYLVIIDTLARCLAGGSDNSPEDMNSFILNCDLIRGETGAHVAVIHHSGKDSSRGARGHTSLRGAVDTEIEILRNAGGNTATVKKQKDDPDGDKFCFKLSQVDLGEDDEGETITSCIVEPIETVKGSSHVKLSNAQKIAFDMLEKAISHEGKTPPADNHIPLNTLCVKEKTWRTYCMSGGISESDEYDANQKAFKRAADKLLAIGLIGKWQELVWLVR